MTSLGAQEVLGRVLRDGAADAARRAVRRITRSVDASLDVGSLDFPLARRDIAAPSFTPSDHNREHGGLPRAVGWLCTPPSRGSGGHTTFFRMVAALEERGASCTILLYDQSRGDIRRHEKTIRSSWPWLRADVRPVPDSLAEFDAVVASSWQTAHVIAVRGMRSPNLRKFYFIQDYEPYFYPRGSLYALAEDSYRLGLRHISLGPMVQQTLMRELGVASQSIPYGCDLTAYKLDNEGARNGVVFFARPGVDRRGYDVGRLALEEFHRRRPEQPIHLFGDRVRGWECPVVQHGVLRASELNRLYNQTLGGLALSFTNITLVATEMLAAGCIPVVNDNSFARAVLVNREAIWSRSTPALLATALVQLVDDERYRERAARAASNKPCSWDHSKRALADILGGGR